MATGVLLTPPIVVFFDNTGAPAVNGSVLTQVGGGNAATFQDVGLTTQLPNPIPLNSRGEVSTSFGASSQCFLTPNTVYTCTLFDAGGNQVWVATYVNGVQTNATTIGQSIYPQSAGEIAAGVQPTSYAYDEGDIRRYGAATSLGDNTSAINQALLVSANGGKSAFIPAGTWAHTATLNATLGCSMYGIGQTSRLAPTTCDGITFTTQGTYEGTRFFRDFEINAVTGTNNTGIVASMSAASGNRITQVQFQNLTIQGFNQGVSARGMWNCVFRDCFLYNNYQGYLFTGQNIQCQVRGGFCQKGALGPPSGGASTQYGILVNSVAGESTQSLHLLGSNVYGYAINISITLGLYTVIENCDVSTATSKGIELVTCNGGTVVRDCWVQTLVNAVSTGIDVVGRAAPSYEKIVIEGNTIECSTANASSVGINIGVSQYGVTTNNNTIGTSTTPWAKGVVNTAAHNHICKFNSIYAVFSAIQIDSLTLNVEIGPNTIQPGAAQVATMANATANIGVVDSSKYTVNQPVTFDASVNGVVAGVTYFVLTAAANVITVSPISGGAALVGTGNTAVNATPQVLPLTFTGATPVGLSYFATGGFILALSGTTGTTCTITWVASGHGLVLTQSSTGSFGAATGTTMVGTGLPAWLWPVTTRIALVRVQDNSANVLGLVSITGGGVMSFFKDLAAGAFTASGNRGYADQIRYEYT